MTYCQADSYQPHMCIDNVMDAYMKLLGNTKTAQDCAVFDTPVLLRLLCCLLDCFFHSLFNCLLCGRLWTHLLAKLSPIAL